jgi:hypothetical protein
MHDSASLEESLENLTIQNHKPDPDIARLAAPSKTKKAADAGKKKPKKEVVADSWEDEISESEQESEKEDDEEEEEVTTSKPGVRTLASKSEGPFAPPPTPAPNTYYNTSHSPGVAGDRSARTARPEKQTAVASRMIAGALGIRAPKRTEEQRAYDRAIKEKEMKRRNREKEEESKAKQEEERAKAAVWDA